MVVLQVWLHLHFLISDAMRSTRHAHGPSNQLSVPPALALAAELSQCSVFEEGGAIVTMWTMVSGSRDMGNKDDRWKKRQYGDLQYQSAINILATMKRWIFLRCDPVVAILELIALILVPDVRIL